MMAWSAAEILLKQIRYRLCTECLRAAESTVAVQWRSGPWGTSCSKNLLKAEFCPFLILFSSDCFVSLHGCLFKRGLTIKWNESHLCGLVQFPLFQTSFMLARICAKDKDAVTPVIRVAPHRAFPWAALSSTRHAENISCPIQELAAAMRWSSPAPFRTIGQQWNRAHCFDSHCLQCHSTLLFHYKDRKEQFLLSWTWSTCYRSNSYP